MQWNSKREFEQEWAAFLSDWTTFLEKVEFERDARELRILSGLFEKLRMDINKIMLDLNETYQLLIGATNIKDAVVQRELAQDSRIQARRATALTALAAVYLPISLATGIFGMNLQEINNAKPRFWAVLAVSFILVVISLLFLI